MTVLVDGGVIIVITDAALLIDKGLDDWRDQTGGKSSVFASLEEHCDDYVGITARRYAHEPTVLFELISLGSRSFPLAQANDL